MNRRRLNIWIFALGVFMLLARPYLIYQMTGAGAFAQNPAKTWNLLQRLVKKKDDHHELSCDGVTILTENRQAPARPFRRLLNLFHDLFFSIPKMAFAIPLPAAKLLFPADRNRYRLTSCLLI